MDPKDLEIEARLQKLRNDTASITTGITDEQLAARLANIRGPGHGSTDEEIAQRLANLKGNKQTPTDKELEERLSKLKGVPIPSTALSNANILITKKKTDVEQVNDLLKQLVTETDIDSCVTSSTTRLMDPRNPTRVSKNGTLPASSSSLKQETMAFVDKLVAESKLAPYEQDSSSEEEEDNNVDDWCTICNEDASLKCKGCSGDLYCASCYREFHTPSDTEDDHPCEKFVKPKRRTRETAL